MAETDILKSPEKAYERVIFYLILSVGIAVRIYDIDRGLWYDEIHHWLNFSSQSLLQVVTRLTPKYNHIFHSILVHLLTRIIGSSHEIAIRTPALISGILQIILTYKLAYALFKNRNVALLSEFLIALSPVHIFYSQSARGYSLEIFLFSLALFFLLRAKDKPLPWVGFTLCGVLASYTILVSIYLIGALYIWYLWPLSRDLGYSIKKVFTTTQGKYFIYSGLIGGLLILLLHIPVRHDLLRIWTQNAKPDFFSYSFIQSIKDILMLVLRGNAFLIGPFSLLGFVLAFKNQPEIGLMYALLLSIPLLIILLTRVPPFGRTLIPTMPLIFILSSYGFIYSVEIMQNKVKGQPNPLLNMGLILLFVCPLIKYIFYDYYVIDKCGNYKQAAAYLSSSMEHPKSTDIIINEDVHNMSYWFYMGQQKGQALKRVYTSGRLGEIYITRDIHPQSLWFREQLTNFSPYKLWQISVINPAWARLVFSPEKMQLIKSFLTTKVYRLQLKHKTLLNSQLDEPDYFKQPSSWRVLDSEFRVKRQIYTDSAIRGQRGIVFQGEKRDAPYVMICNKIFSLPIPPQSIMILLYAKKKGAKSFATLCRINSADEVVLLNMLQINRMIRRYDDITEGPDKWQLWAQIFITQQQIDRLGIVLHNLGEVIYDDFVGFVLQ